MVDRCDVCGLKYLEDQGDLFGYLFLLDRGLFIFPLVAMIYFRSYVPNQNWFYLLCLVMLFTLFYTLPHRTGMSLSLEYYFHHTRAAKGEGCEAARRRGCDHRHGARLRSTEALARAALRGLPFARCETRELHADLGRRSARRRRREPLRHRTRDVSAGPRRLAGAAFDANASPRARGLRGARPSRSFTRASPRSRSAFRRSSTFRATVYEGATELEIRWVDFYR